MISVIAHSRAGRKYINRLCGQRDREATEAYREMMWGRCGLANNEKSIVLRGLLEGGEASTGNTCSHFLPFRRGSFQISLANRRTWSDASVFMGYRMTALMPGLPIWRWE